jgi:Fe-S-cluster-containing dehydrogenase component
MTIEGFIFDYSKCVGCHACIVACSVENKTQPPIAWRQIDSYNTLKIPLAGFLNLSLACNHCIEAPCLKACPSKAYTKDLQTGAVIHQPENCIGCRYCTWACPFNAPKYNARLGIVEKCNLCNHLIINGSKPACAKQCPTGALSFGLIEINGNSESFGIPKSNFQPRFDAFNENVVDNIPEMDMSISGFDLNTNLLFKDERDTKINPNDEWPLVFFTFVFSFLTGWIFFFKDHNSMPLKVVFMTLGLLGLIISTIHLGRPLKAPRAVLNLKTSWLSREIILSGFFVVSSFTYLFLLKSNFVIAITSLIGLLFLGAVEMVYSVARKNYILPIHSSNTILTAVLFGFFFNQHWKLLVGIIVLKGVLYIIRKAYSLEKLTFINMCGITLRVLLGSIIPIGIINFSNTDYSLYVLGLLIVAELIDRYDFYKDIYVDSPSRELGQVITNHGAE